MVNPGQVYLFIGSEEYLKGEAMRELKSSLLGTDLSEGLDYKIFCGDESPAMEILDYAATFPFSSSKKLMIIKNAERLPREDMDRLVTYIKKPAPFTTLVIDAQHDSILQEIAPVMGRVKVSRFDNLSDSHLRSWIKRFVASRDRSIENEAVEILMELQDASPLSLAQELEKLITFVGEVGRIKKSDCEALVGKSQMESAFEIGWAIGEKSPDKALALISDLVSRGKKPYEIIGLLHWHLRRMLKAKVLMLKSESDSYIGNILRIQRRRFAQFFRQVRSYDIGRIGFMLKALLRADLDIKNARYDPNLILELAVVRLCLG